MTILDISGLPSPAVIEPLSFEAINDRQIVDFKERWEAVRQAYPGAGLPEYDVEMLETDPAIIVLEAIAYSELLIRDRVNVALKSILPAFARGTDLEAIASRLGVGRATGETDRQLLERYLLALARPSAGSHDGYLASVLEAWPQRADAAVLGPETHNRKGEIDVILAAANGGSVSSGIIAGVRAAVTSRSAKPLTDVVTVRAANVVTYDVAYRIHIAEGRNTGPILAAARAAAAAFVVDRYIIGQPIKRTAILATGYVPGVIAVDDLTGGANVSVDPDDVPWCAPADIVVEVAS